MNSGLISKILDWTTHPMKDNSSIMDWIAGLGLVLIAAFLWSQVVKQIA
jgi:hypothetical protein